MTTEIFAIQKTGKTLSVNQVQAIFDSTDNLAEIKSAVEKSDSRVYTSWASVDMGDNDGERISINDLIKRQNILINERNGTLIDNHTNKPMGKTISFKVIPHPITKSIGILHLNVVFKNYKNDDKVWEEIKSGEREGSSVGGGADGIKDGYDPVTNKPVKDIQNFEHYETSSVFKPCNPMATNHAVAVAKGDENTNSNQIKMSEEKKKKQENTSNTEVKKEDDVVGDADNAEDKMSGIEARLDQMEEVLRAITEKLSGGTEEEKGDEDHGDPEDEGDDAGEEKAEDTEDEDEEKKKSEESEVVKKLDALTNEVKELKKSQVKEVIKTDRPAANAKKPSEEKTDSVMDIVKKLNNKETTVGELKTKYGVKQ